MSAGRPDGILSLWDIRAMPLPNTNLTKLGKAPSKTHNVVWLHCKFGDQMLTSSFNFVIV